MNTAGEQSNNQRNCSVESNKVAVSDVEGERVKVQRRSLRMHEECARLCAEPASWSDELTIEDLKQEALDTQDLLESLSEIMASIHSVTSSLGTDVNWEMEDDFSGELDGDDSEFGMEQ